MRALQTRICALANTITLQSRVAVAEPSETPPRDDEGASDEVEQPVAVPEKDANVTRTPLRPAGSIRETPREIAVGFALGLALFAGGARVVWWAFVRWLVHGGSSTVLAFTVLLPVALPLVVGSIMGERGRKPLGYAMIVGVVIGLMCVSMYGLARFQGAGAAVARPGVGSPLPTMPR